jgi:hypothetical protein
MRNKTRWIGYAVALAALGIGLALQSHSQQLPNGFTIQKQDGVTYVCSTTPVICTGNEPNWAKP